MLYHYDLAGHLIAETDENGTPIREYLYLGEQAIATRVSGNRLYYVHNDHLGTPRILTDPQQNKVWEEQTTPFGEVSEEITTGITNLKGFPGQYRDSETGYVDNWHRTYDPSIGRYVQSDPIGLAGGLNTYGYVNGNPLSYVDPLGLEADPYCVAACTAAGSIAGGTVGQSVGTAGGGLGGGALGTLVGPEGTVFGAVAGGATGGRVGGALGAVLGGALGNAAGNLFCPDHDDECEKERQQLEQGRQALLNWRFTGLTLPERIAQAEEYNEQVLDLNLLIAFHNQKCPEHRVEPLSTIPISGKSDY